MSCRARRDRMVRYFVVRSTTCALQRSGVRSLRTRGSLSLLPCPVIWPVAPSHRRPQSDCRSAHLCSSRCSSRSIRIRAPSNTQITLHLTSPGSPATLQASGAECPRASGQHNSPPPFHTHTHTHTHTLQSRGQAELSHGLQYTMALDGVGRTCLVSSRGLGG